MIHRLSHLSYFVVVVTFASGCGQRDKEPLNSPAVSQQVANPQSDGHQLGLFSPGTMTIEQAADNYRVFESDEKKGVCYRIPSFVRAGRFVVAIAQKRQGFTKDKTISSANKRPVRLSKQSLENVTTCGDEAFISISMKMARLERFEASRELNVKSLVWSPEIVVVDMQKFLRRAVDPTSRFYEPILYDYLMRLKNNQFGRDSTGWDSGYKGCFFGENCSQLSINQYNANLNCFNGANPSMKTANMLSGYIHENFASCSSPLNTDDLIKKWLSQGENALNLVNIRFAAQSAVGFIDNGVPFVGLAGVIGYPTVPHASHHAFAQSDSMFKLAGLRVNLNELWKVAEKSATPLALDVQSDQSIVEWKNDFNTDFNRISLNNLVRWLDSGEGKLHQANFDSRLADAVRPSGIVPAKLQSVNLKETNGLDEDVTPPKSLAEILDLIRRHSYIDRPLTEPVEQNLDIQMWKSAIISIYNRNNLYYAGIDLKRDAEADAFRAKKFDKSVVWTMKDLTEAHAKLGIAIARDLKVIGVEQMRLAVVMSAYGRLLNSKLNYVARNLNKICPTATPDVKEQNAGAQDQKCRDSLTPLLERLRRVIFKAGRVGPGNAINMPRENRIFLPLAGGFPLTVSYSFDQMDTNYDDTGIKLGEERQAAIIGRTINDDYVFFMTVRHSGIDFAADKDSFFNLSSWTRVLSASYDSGRTWMPDSFLAPTYKDSLGRPLTKIRPSDVEGLVEVDSMGFRSSEVQSSIASIPGFFGKGRPLALHLAPETSTEAMIYNKEKQSVTDGQCLGGIAMSKSGGSCDYRKNLRLIPGMPMDFKLKNSDGRYNVNLPGKDAVSWRFDKARTVQSGSAGYSAIDYLGRDDCGSAKVGLAFEGTAQDALEKDGYNNGINVRFLKISGADFRHLPMCAQNPEIDAEY